MRDGKPAEISDFRANDRLTATIITTKPPRVMTEKEVQATLAKSGGGGAARPPPRRAAAAAAPQPARQLGAATGASSGRTDLGRRRPRALRRRRCPRPPAHCRLLGLVGLASLVAGLGLTVRRRRATR